MLKSSSSIICASYSAVCMVSPYHPIVLCFLYFLCFLYCIFCFVFALLFVTVVCFVMSSFGHSLSTQAHSSPTTLRPVSFLALRSFVNLFFLFKLFLFAATRFYCFLRGSCSRFYLSLFLSLSLICRGGPSLSSQQQLPHHIIPFSAIISANHYCYSCIRCFHSPDTQFISKDMLCVRPALSVFIVVSSFPIVNITSQ